VRDLTARGLEMTTGRSDLNVRYHFGSVHKAEIERWMARIRNAGGAGALYRRHAGD
jgi:hypothetical protein